MQFAMHMFVGSFHLPIGHVLDVSHAIALRFIHRLMRRGSFSTGHWRVPVNTLIPAQGPRNTGVRRETVSRYRRCRRDIDNRRLSLVVTRAVRSPSERAFVAALCGLFCTPSLSQRRSTFSYTAPRETLASSIYRSWTAVASIALTRRNKT